MWRIYQIKEDWDNIYLVIADENLSADEECAWIWGHKRMTKHKNETIPEQWLFNIVRICVVERLYQNLKFFS